MSEQNDQFDRTIWDPEKPKHAIEDPMYGPSAIFNMLQQPPMPMGDGRYYQPGLYSLVGSPYVDSKGRAWDGIEIGLPAGSMRRIHELREWIEACQQGEEAVVALEAARQRARLARSGVAFCFRTSDVCPGGKRLNDCETGSAAYEQAQEWTDEDISTNPNHKPVWTTGPEASRKCGQCALQCEVAVKMVDGTPDETRVAFTKPVELPLFSEAITMLTDSKALGRRVVPLITHDPVQDARRFFRFKAAPDKVTDND